MGSSEYLKNGTRGPLGGLYDLGHPTQAISAKYRRHKKVKLEERYLGVDIYDHVVIVITLRHGSCVAIL